MSKKKPNEIWWCVKSPQVGLLYWTCSWHEKTSKAKYMEVILGSWEFWESEGYKVVKISVQEIE